MKLLISLLILMMLAGACMDNQSDTFDAAQVEQEILQEAQDVVWGLNNNHADTLMAQFWQSDSAMFMIDGRRIQGYEQIGQGLRGAMSQRKSMDLSLTAEDVMVLSPESAIHIADFEQTVTNMEDSTTSASGTWAAVYKKVDGEWEVVLVHESHLPAIQ